MRHRLPTFLAACFATGLQVAAAQAQETEIEVPGTADPWLAGMPDGSTASDGDVAPVNSPVDVTGIKIVEGTALSFEVAGSVSNTPGPSGATPDGGGIFRHGPGATNGLSDLAAPINALVGVFLAEDRPDAYAAPEALDFSDPTARDAAEIAPQLQQIFFIGDGLTEKGVRQRFIVPKAATRLFLGGMDGYGWYNNSGGFRVRIGVSYD